MFGLFVFAKFGCFVAKTRYTALNLSESAADFLNKSEPVLFRNISRAAPNENSFTMCNYDLYMA